MTRPAPSPMPPGHGSCEVSTQAICFGPIETSVFAVAGAAALAIEDRSTLGFRLRIA